MAKRARTKKQPKSLVGRRSRYHGTVAGAGIQCLAGGPRPVLRLERLSTPDGAAVPDPVYCSLTPRLSRLGVQVDDRIEVEARLRQFRGEDGQGYWLSYPTRVQILPQEQAAA